MKNILVIGASGNIGKGLLPEISSKYNVTGTYFKSELNNSNINSVQLDITKTESFNNLHGSYDAVLLMAAAMPASMKGYDQSLYVNVNITGVLNVLEFCRKNNIKKVIYIMTFSDVSGSFYSGVPIKETDKRTLTYKGDHAVYAISKVTACELIEHYHQEYGLQTIIFRIPTVYCCDDTATYHVDGKVKTKAYIQMIRNVIQHKEIELWGDPNNAKDMPYIKDFSRLVVKSIEHQTAQGLFNAGTGSPIALTDFVDGVINVFSDDGEVEKINRPELPSQPNFTFDMSKTRKVFDYENEYDLIRMLEDIKLNSPESVFGAG